MLNKIKKYIIENHLKFCVGIITNTNGNTQEKNN
jgi:hypothetical protein